MDLAVGPNLKIGSLAGHLGYLFSLKRYFKIISTDS